MANQELGRIVDQQIKEIFSDLASSEDLIFEETAHMLELAKLALINTPEFEQAVQDSFFTQKPSVLTFSVDSRNFKVFYYKRDNPDTEEHLSITVDNKEKIDIHTYEPPKNRGEARADLNYFDDGPDFINKKFSSFRLSSQQATRIVGYLLDAGI